MQFDSPYNPQFIDTDGAAFGQFSGVTISEDGLVTALFANGDIRPIFKVPVATFPKPERPRNQHRQRLQPDRHIRPVLPSHAEHRRRRIGPVLGLGILDRRHRERVHADDHHAARLFGQCEDHIDRRRNARRARPHQTLKISRPPPTYPVRSAVPGFLFLGEESGGVDPTGLRCRPHARTGAQQRPDLPARLRPHARLGTRQPGRHRSRFCRRRNNSKYSC